MKVDTIRSSWANRPITKYNLWDYINSVTEYIDDSEFRMERNLRVLYNFLDKPDPNLVLCKSRVHPFYISKLTRTPVRLHLSCSRWDCDGCSLANISPYIVYLYIEYLCTTLDGGPKNEIYVLVVDARSNKTVRDKLSRLHVPRFTFSLKNGGLLVILKYPVAFQRSHNIQCIPITFQVAITSLLSFDHSKIERGFPNQLWTVKKVFSNAEVEALRSQFTVRNVTESTIKAKGIQKSVWYVTVKSEREGWYLEREPEQLEESKAPKSHYIPNTTKDFVAYLAEHGILIDRPLPDGMTDADLTRIIESYVPARDFRLMSARMAGAR